MGQGIHSGGTRTISGVSLRDVTKTQITGSSQTTAAATMTRVRIHRRMRTELPWARPSKVAPGTDRRTAAARDDIARLVFCMSPENPELDDRKDKNHSLPPAQEEGGFGRRYHIADLGPFKLLDAVAPCDTTGRQVTLAVVNRDKDREHKVTIQLVGGRAASGVYAAEVNGVGPEAMNSFDHPDAVGVQEHRLNLGGSTFEYVFPAHSVTVLRLDLA